MEIDNVFDPFSMTCDHVLLDRACVRFKIMSLFFFSISKGEVSDIENIRNSEVNEKLNEKIIYKYKHIFSKQYELNNIRILKNIINNIRMHILILHYFYFWNFSI